MSGVVKRGSVKVFDKPVGGFGAGERSDRFRVDFDPDAFIKFIKTKGYDVIWEKALYCPQLKGLGPRDHDLACTVCDGSGFVYYDSTPTRMMLQSLKLEEAYYAFGRFDTGSVMLSALPKDRISFWDRITLCNGEARFAELLFRSPDSLRDRPKYNPLEIDRLQWVDTNGVVQTYTPPSFSIDVVTGEIVWTATRPNAQTYYTVSYLYRPIYRVTDMVHLIRETPVRDATTDRDVQTELPLNAIAQLDFLIRDESQDQSSEDQRRDPFNPELGSR